jgi:hypothetical protein
MAFLEIRASTLCNALIIIAGLLVGGFLLLMGVGNLIYPDVAEEHLAVNTFMCLLVSFVSLFPLLAGVAALRGILHSKQDSKDQS